MLTMFTTQFDVECLRRGTIKAPELSPTHSGDFTVPVAIGTSDPSPESWSENHPAALASSAPVQAAPAGVWRPHGTDSGMQMPEACDLTGGATDCQLAAQAAPVAQERELPPLPPPQKAVDVWVTNHDTGRRSNRECEPLEPHFSADQMQEYARAALAATPQAQPECQPTLTECPRCKNDVLGKCPMFAERAALYVSPEQFLAVKDPDVPPGSVIWYEADAPIVSDESGQHAWGRFRPGMFMPRWASRIGLEVTGMRVERLQAISVRDAIAEGIPAGGPENPDGIEVRDYRALWEQLNGAGSWDANPWVWVVEFRRVQA